MKTRLKLPRVLAVTLVTAALIPLVNTALIRSLGIYFAADPLTYGYTLAEVISYIYNFIDVLAVFASSACLAYAVIVKRHRLSVFVTAAVSLVLVYAAAALSEVLVDSRTIDGVYIFESAVNCAFELIRYGIVALAASIVARRAAKKAVPRSLELLSASGLLSRGAITTCVCIAATMLLSLTLNTVLLVQSYGAPEQASEVMELAMPYITALIHSILGYFAAYSAMSAAEGKRS